MGLGEFSTNDAIYLAYGFSIVLLIIFGLVSDVKSNRALGWGVILIAFALAAAMAISIRIDGVIEMIFPPLRGMKVQTGLAVRQTMENCAFPFFFYFLSVIGREEIRKRVCRQMPTRDHLVVRVRKELLMSGNTPGFAELLEAEIEKGFHAAGLVADSCRVEELRKDIAHGAGFYDHERRIFVLDIKPDVGLIFDIVNVPHFIQPRV